MFVLFNLYSPNETNDSRRPYKMNFLHALQERVKLLMSAGREVIIAGDINIVRAPIDSGEGGIRSSAEQHYEHPARRILEAWCAPKGPMIDVVRESWPDRDDMFTCWNQKIDARWASRLPNLGSARRRTILIPEQTVKLRIAYRLHPLFPGVAALDQRRRHPGQSVRIGSLPGLHRSPRFNHLAFRRSPPYQRSAQPAKSTSGDSTFLSYGTTADRT